MIDLLTIICTLLLMGFIFWGAFVIEEVVMNWLTGKGLLEQVIEWLEELEMKRR